MKKKWEGHKISQVDPGSIAEELELVPGDYVLAINGTQVEDIFDYEYYINSPSITMLVRKADGEEWELDIENDYEDLGLTFEKGLMSDYRSCCNQCIFCFIDQMPKGMRETLYFKDDDARLSFLQGNYITLTNMSEEDLGRIIRYKLSPINISVHATNPELRCRLLCNRFAGGLLGRIRRLSEAGIEMNSQVVLCKGYNDGEELDRTIRELSAFLPNLKSLSVVPVGLTKYREGLAPLEPFGAEEAMQVLIQIHAWQEKLLAERGTRFVFASDEWYILADHPIPPASYYEGYGQLENGVGMVRSLMEEVRGALEEWEGEYRQAPAKRRYIATGELAAPFIKELAEEVMGKFPHVSITVFPIRNDFFGELITVAGLVTAQDIIAQLKDKELQDGILLLPEAMLRDGEDVFLDDLSVGDVEEALQTCVRIVKSDGESFLRALAGDGGEPASGGFCQKHRNEE